MDIFAGLDLATATFVGLATFGSVSAVNFFRPLDSKQNFLLSIAFAFVFGFVPANLGNEIANRVKEALTIGVALNGAYQFTSKVATKVGGIR